MGAPGRTYSNVLVDLVEEGIDAAIGLTMSHQLRPLSRAGCRFLFSAIAVWAAPVICMKLNASFKLACYSVWVTMMPV